MKKIMLILIILASLTQCILAVVQYIDNEKKEKENKENEIKLHTKVDSLNNENINLNKNIKKLSEDNYNLSIQLTKTAIELNNNVIGKGGDDIDITFNLIGDNQFEFILFNKSESVINNAKIKIQDFNEIIKCPKIYEDSESVKIKLDCFQAHTDIVDDVVINPKSTTRLDKKYSFLQNYTNFVIRIESRKNTVYYHIVLQKTNHILAKSVRLYDVVDEKKILRNEINQLNLKKEYWAINFYEKTLRLEN